MMKEYELLCRADKLLMDASKVQFDMVEKVLPLTTEALACIALAAELRIRRVEKDD